MAEELLDIVDAWDRVVGAAPRGEVHRRRLRHRAVHMLVFNRHGRVFVHKRTATRECDPNLWDSSAAGHVASGERYLDAARRELAEELGIPWPDDAERLFRLRASEATHQEFITVYRLVTPHHVRPDGREMAAWRWLEPATLSAWLEAEPHVFTGALRLIWQRLRPRDGAASGRDIIRR